MSLNPLAGSKREASRSPSASPAAKHFTKARRADAERATAPASHEASPAPSRHELSLPPHETPSTFQSSPPLDYSAWQSSAILPPGCATQTSPARQNRRASSDDGMSIDGQPLELPPNPSISSSSGPPSSLDPFRSFDREPARSFRPWSIPPPPNHPCSSSSESKKPSSSDVEKVAKGPESVSSPPEVSSPGAPINPFPIQPAFIPPPNPSISDSNESSSSCSSGMEESSQPPSPIRPITPPGCPGTPEPPNSVSGASSHPQDSDFYSPSPSPPISLASSDTQASHPSFTDPKVKLPITIGCEIEIVFVYNKAVAARDFGVAPQHPPHRSFSWHDIRNKEKEGEPNPLRMVIKALKSAGVDVYWEPEDEEVRFQQGGELPSSFSRWTVDSDSSITLYHDYELRSAHPDSSKHPTFGLEIKSPVFSYDDDEWQESIWKVIRVLHSTFNDRADNDDYRLYTPHSSGLHVHVGIGTKETRYNFPVSTVRNLLQLGTGFERIIDELHSKDRIDTRGGFCKGPARFFRPRSSGAPRAAISFEEDFFSSSQDQQQNEDTNAFPPGIVADGLALADDILARELATQRTAMQQLEDDMWRRQKLEILSDRVTSRRPIGLHNAILVEACLLRAFPNMSPVIDLRRTQTAREYTDANASDLRQEYVAKVASLLRAIAPEAPGGPLREIMDGQPGSSPPSAAEAPFPVSSSDPAPEHGSGSDSNSDLGAYVVDWVKYLEQNLRTFRDLSSPDGPQCYPDRRAVAYNLQNLVTCPADVGQKGTIEFRQHRGSIDAEEIIAWIEVTACMVRFAHAKSLTPGAMVSVVKKHAYDPSFDLVSFLRLIKVSDETIRYYKMWLDTLIIHAKRVQRVEQHETPNSATAELSRLFAEFRQEDKNPIAVMETIRSKLRNGDYCVPRAEKARLLETKYAEYELNGVYVWKHQSRRTAACVGP